MKRIIPCIFAAVLLSLLCFSAFSVWRVHTAREEARAALRELQRQAEALSEENEALRQALSHSGSEEALRQIAREQLGLVLPEDRIYIVGDDN